MKPTDPSSLVLPAGYADWLVQRYGRIGRDILERQHSAGWGAKVIDRLARDLKDALPTCAAGHRASSSTCGFLPSMARMVDFGSRLLPNCRGSIS